MNGYEYLSHRLTSLITYHPPPCIFIHDPINTRLCGLAVRSVLQEISDNPEVTLSYAILDGISCFTPRLLYDTAINELAGWTPQWEAGCSNWPGPSDLGQRFNDNFDGFVHGIKTFGATLSHPRGKGKAKQGGTSESDTENRIILVIQHADRLKETMPDLLVPLTRLNELTQMDITVIFLSDLRWDQIKPSLGASPEPYHIEIEPFSREATLERLAALYSEVPTSDETDLVSSGTYHPELKQLYVHFLDTLYSVCSPFTTDPDDLAYIAAARWPGFVKPIIDSRRQLIEDGHSEDEIGWNVPGEARLQLTAAFTQSFTEALNELYPRRSSALEWARSNIPPEDILSRQQPRSRSKAAPSTNTAIDPQASRLLESLPRMAKFILVAAFIASTNPAKSDLKMFGRGPDERKKRRRKGGMVRKTGRSGAVKIPQRLLGPIAFPLDRLIAILGVLLEENDADQRPDAPEYSIPGEYTEMEISRIAIFNQVIELTSMNLLHRTSPGDRLEPSPMFRCGIIQEVARSLAKDIQIDNLNDLIWEPM